MNDENNAPTAPAHFHNAQNHCERCFRENEEMKQQIAEIHSFIQMVGEALNNPMLRSMLPPGMRV